MHFLRYQLPALIAMVAGITNAHIIMESPVPYGHPDSNPLLADGSDYPCKQGPDVYKVVKQNVMPIGQPQTLSFIGQATHGGGSCQISITTDKQPTKNSVWKVIHSIEGGCPSKAPGNLGGDPMGHGTDKFQFSIPQQVPTGDYTLAWTWFNKIGNREMYMNCAPITVTGGGSSSHKRGLNHHRHGASKRQHEVSMIEERDNALSSLPNMFVANIGNGCNTAPSGTTLAIPQKNLGTSVDHHAPDELVPPVGNCGGAPAAAAPAGAVRPISVPAPAAPASSQPAAPVSIPSSAPQSPAPAPAPQAPPASPMPNSPQAPAPAPAPAAPAGYTTGKCTTPGKSVCALDGMGIGTCDEKMIVMFAPAPMGTKCDPSLGVLVHARGFEA